MANRIPRSISRAALLRSRLAYPRAASAAATRFPPTCSEETPGVFMVVACSLMSIFRQSGGHVRALVRKLTACREGAPFTPPGGWCLPTRLAKNLAKVRLVGHASGKGDVA